MTAALQKLDDGTIKLTITIPAPVVKKTQEEVVSELVKNAKLAGFRKGKAPKKLVEEKLDKQEVQEEVLKKLLPSAYLEAIKQHNLKPIINPKIHVQKVGVGADWIFEALTCEMPEVKLDGYKEAIAKLTAKSKIIVPGKEPFDSAQGKPEIKFEEIVKTLLENVTIAIPKILIDNEVERLLSQLLDDIKKLGLTLEQYLASTNRTAATLRAEYEKKAENDIKLEFALQKIAEVEKVTVEEKEIEEAIQKGASV
ncbi:MAG: hypothetical protein HYS68_00935 [Candidatus Levybacteria bacterium]|nr:hypothetical protein [Candidatus Levybacteria bacterium]